MALIDAAVSTQGPGSAGTNFLNNLNLQNGDNFINNIANKFIVKPKTVKGIGGFVFDYEGEDQVAYQADITDHYVETNIAIQDHMALKPVRITLRGFVGELIQRAPAGVLGAIQTLQSKLTTVQAYAGKYTPQQIQTIQKGLTSAQAAVNNINQSLAKVQNIIGMFPGMAPQKSKQQQAFAQLLALLNSRQVFSVETPWTTYDKMVIESLVFIQPEETRFWTDISVTLKQMRFVETETVASSSVFGGRALYQRQTPVNQGRTAGTPVPESTLHKYFGVN